MRDTFRILIVDDEPDIRDALSRHFRFMGYQVDTAANGNLALEHMEKVKVDIVISDIMMPERDGIQLLREIRREYPMTHVIMMTGYVTQENVLACMRLGAQICILKPIEDMAELEDAVQIAVKALQRWKQVFIQLHKLGISGNEDT
jgi:CheY-like chemotaxis protein